MATKQKGRKVWSWVKYARQDTYGVKDRGAVRDERVYFVHIEVREGCP